MGALSNWDRFIIVFLKNFCIQRLSHLNTAASVLIPVFFMMVLVFGRFMIQHEDIPVRKFKPLDTTQYWNKLMEKLQQRKIMMDEKNPNFTYSHFVPDLAIGYAPSSVKCFSMTMDRVSEKLQFVRLVGLANCTELMEAMDYNHYFAGVCFNSDVIENNELRTITNCENNFPDVFKYKMIFPTELRVYGDTYIGNNWNTNGLFDVTLGAGRIGLKAPDGGFMGYMREGVLPLQQAISMSYLELIEPDVKLPNVVLQRFPTHAHSEDPLVASLDLGLSFVLLLGYLFPVINLSKYVVEEKSRQLKEMLRLLYIPNWMHLLCWYLTGWVWMILSSFLVVIVLKFHWYEGANILYHSSPLAIFLMLIVYSAVSVAFGLMISSFFLHLETIGPMLSLCWFLSYMPYYLTCFYDRLDNVAIVFTYLFSNTAMGMALDSIIESEIYRSGFGWSGYLNRKAIKADYPVIAYVLIMVFQTFVYFFIALYVEALKPGRYGVPADWFFCLPYFSKNTIPPRSNRENEIPTTRPAMARVVEIQPGYKQIAVTIQDVTKKYGKTVAVRNVSFNLYHNEITILMGHNGSGKSTLVSVLAGLTLPTVGTAIINGFDICTQREDARRNMGVVASPDDLFYELKVDEQLYFFSRLRGLDHEMATDEVEKYLKIMKLKKRRSAYTWELTSGEMQHLAVCCALVGGTTVIIMDESTAGMDYSTRVRMWDILLREKIGRCIMLTSHLSQETETLADQIIILSQGEVKCSGSPQFLKKVYGKGFRLILAKGLDCDTDVVTEVIRQYVPSIVLECDVGTELSYIIPEIFTFTLELEDLLKEIEDRMEELSLDSVSLTEAMVKHIFLIFGIEDPSEENSERFLEAVRGEPLDKEAQAKFMKIAKHRPITGYDLWINQWYAMFLKRIYYLANYPLLIVFMVIVPAIFVGLSFFNAHLSLVTSNLQEMKYSLRQYQKTITIVDSRTSLTGLAHKIDEEYRQSIFWIGVNHILDDTFGALFTDHFIEKNMSEGLYHVYVIGGTFGHDEIIAWFNNYPLHTAPLSLNMVHQAIARALIRDNAIIEVTFEPHDFDEERQRVLIRGPRSLSHFLIINITCGMSFVWGVGAIYRVRERHTRFQFLQYLCGVRRSIYWLSSGIWSILMSCVLAVCLLIALTIFEKVYLPFFPVAGWCFFLTILAGGCVGMCSQLVSLFCRNGLFAYGLIVSFCTFGTVCFWFHSRMFRTGYGIWITHSHAGGMAFLFHMLPTFVLSIALLKLFDIAEWRELCNLPEVYEVSTLLEECELKPNCCVLPDVWSWEMGIIPDVLNLLGIYAGFFLIIIVIRSVDRVRCKQCFKWKKHGGDRKILSDSESERIVTSEIILQQKNIKELSADDMQNLPLGCQGVSKSYGSEGRIEDIYLTIDRGECFGIIGSNASGKSLLMKLFVGEEKLTEGNIYINGINLKEKPANAYKHISYCPRLDGYVLSYTCREFLRIICLLNGVPRSRIKSVSETLAKVYGFYRYLDKPMYQASHGIRKRLTMSYAILGRPSIMFADDPMNGVDIAGRLLLNTIFRQIQSNDISIVFTALDSNECQTSCNRIALLTSGRFVVIGTPRDIMKKYFSGYLLEVKLKPRVQSLITGDEARLNYLYWRGFNYTYKLQAYIEQEFHRAKFINQQARTVWYFIPTESASVKSIFTALHRQMFILNIEFFNITRNSLALLNDEFVLTAKQTPNEYSTELIEI